MALHSAADYEKAVAAQNSRIESILTSDEPDTEILFSLVADRNELVNQCLKTLEGEARNNFAKNELNVNDDFTQRTQLLFSASLKSLSKFVKDAKAVRKYR